MNSSTKIFKDAYFYYLSKIIPGIFALIFLTLFTRVIGINEYGKYSFYISQFNLIASFSFGWINQSQLRYGSKPSLSFKKYEYVFPILLSLMIALLLLLIFNILSNYNNNILLSIYCISSIGLFSFFKTFYQRKLLSYNVFILASFQSIMSIVIPLLFTFYLDITYQYLLLTTAISFSSTIIALNYKNIKLNLKKIIYQPKIFPKNLKKWIYYGFPVSIWSIIGLLLPYLDRFFISKYLDESQLGVYSSLNDLLIRTFSFLIFPITMATHPIITNLWNKNQKREAKKIIINIVFIMLIIIAITVLVLSIMKNQIFDLIRIILPMLPDNAKTLVPSMLLTGLVWQLSFITHKFIELSEKTYVMIIFIFISLIINLIGNIIYVPIYGLYATVITSLGSALIYCFLTIIYSINKMKEIV